MAQGSSPAAPTSGAQDSTNDLSVVVGKTVLVDTQAPIARVAIGLGGFAELHGVSPTEIMVMGKAPGETSLIIWDIHGGREFFNLTVHPPASVSGDTLDGVRRELRTELPGQTVKVSYDNNTIFLRGTVNDLNASARAVQIAASSGSKVVNLLDVNVPASDPQILLKVRYMSVDRSLEKQLGINLFDLGLGNAYGGVSTGQYSPPTITAGGSSGSSSSGQGVGTAGGSATVSNDLNLLAFFPGLKSGATIAAVEQKGLLETLAEPNLLTKNGHEASFLAGGEFPYPSVQGATGGVGGAVTIQFKEYGIRLNFIPTVTPQGTIRLQVAPEVSALDYTNEVTLAGFTVPGLTDRKVNTEVELKDGQSFIIGGLLDNTETESFQKIPFLGDIPILGKLFQSMQKTRNNTELLVIVTPEVVAPIPAGQDLPSLKFPTKFLPPNSNVAMNNPDAKTAENTLAPSPTVVPVEKLIDSLKPEQPLIIQGESGNFGNSGGFLSSTTPTAPTGPSTTGTGANGP
ncbi:MAG TPA: pilus assembly protein N-terminal domain-containing protein [Terracidiphilus sp.]|nr:pilus assembly protein N-terminal domain-containing protein [Terracidiphilus sp.]